MAPGSRGMTLLEVMVAVALLATVFLLVVATLPAVFDAQERTEREELAAALAATVMERTRERPFGELASWSGDAAFEITTGSARRLEEFSYRVDVTSVATDLRDVVLTVAWTDRGEVRELVLQTRRFAGMEDP